MSMCCRAWNDLIPMQRCTVWQSCEETRGLRELHVDERQAGKLVVKRDLKNSLQVIWFAVNWPTMVRWAGHVRRCDCVCRFTVSDTRTHCGETRQRRVIIVSHNTDHDCCPDSTSNTSFMLISYATQVLTLFCLFNNYKLCILTTVIDRFWHASLGVRSAKHRHQSPEWATIASVWERLLDFRSWWSSGLHPHSRRASWWSLYFSKGIAAKILASISSSALKVLHFCLHVNS